MKELTPPPGLEGTLGLSDAAATGAAPRAAAGKRRDYTPPPGADDLFGPVPAPPPPPGPSLVDRGLELGRRAAGAVADFVTSEPPAPPPQEGPRRGTLAAGARPYVAGDERVQATVQRSVLEQPAPDAAKEEPLTTPLSPEMAQRLRATLAAMTPEERYAAEQIPDWRGQAARALNEQLAQEAAGAQAARLPGNTLESRRDFYARQGAGPEAATSMARTGLAVGADPTLTVPSARPGKDSLLTPEEEQAARAEGRELGKRSTGARGLYAAKEGAIGGTAGVMAAALRLAGDEEGAKVYEKVGQGAAVRADAANELRAMQAHAAEQGVTPSGPLTGPADHLESLGTGAAHSAGAMLPALAAGAATGSPMLGYSLMLAPAWGRSYVAKREAGGSPAAAASYAGAMTALEYLGERYGLLPQALNAFKKKASELPVEEVPDFIERGIQAMEKRGLFSKPVGAVVRGQAGEQIGEQLTGAGQYLLDGTALGLDQPISLSDFLANARDTAVQTALATGAVQFAGAGAKRALEAASRGTGAPADAPAPAAPRGRIEPTMDPLAAPAGAPAPAPAPAAAAAAPAAAPAPAPAADDTAPIDATELLGTPMDEAAHAAATSPLNDRSEPTDAQKEAGNYAKGHVRVSGLDVSIENPKGSIRRSKADAPTPWFVTMPAHYGYIRGTTGSDGDHVDLFIGGRGDNGRFWIINQKDADSGKHDEHKVVTGVDSADEALALYKASFAGGFGDRVYDSMSGELDAGSLKALLPSLEKPEPVEAGDAQQPDVAVSAVVAPAAAAQPGGDAGRSGGAVGPATADAAGGGAAAPAAPVAGGKPDQPVQPADGPYAALSDREKLAGSLERFAEAFDQKGGGASGTFAAVLRSYAGDVRSGAIPDADLAGVMAKIPEYERLLGRPLDDQNPTQGPAAQAAGGEAPQAAGGDAPGEDGGADVPATGPAAVQAAGLNPQRGEEMELDGERFTVLKTGTSTITLVDGADKRRTVARNSPTFAKLKPAAAAVPAPAPAPSAAKLEDKAGDTDAARAAKADARAALADLGDILKPQGKGAEAPAAAPAPAPARPKKRRQATAVRGSEALGAISIQGRGIAPELLADLSQKVTRVRVSKTGKRTTYTAWDNPPHAGFGPLFRAGGTSDLTEIARILEEAGYIEAGLLERDYGQARSLAQDIVKAELAKGGSTLRVGDADAIEAAARRHEDDAPPVDEFDGAGTTIRPEDELDFDPFATFSPEDLVDSGYADASAEVRALTEKLLAAADEAGIDTELLRDGASRETPEDAPEDAYHARLQELIRESLAEASGREGDAGATQGSDRDRGEAAGAPAGARGDRADGPDQAGAQDEGLTLTSPTAADLEAADQRAAAARAADDAEQRRLANKQKADAERDEFVLTGSDRPADVAAAAGQGGLFDSAVSAQEAPAAPAPALPEAKSIEDAGEKIGGARKDRWKDRGLDVSDLDAMSESEGATLATKANVWKPDYAAIVAAGAPPKHAALVKVVYDRLAASPAKNTPEGRRQYVTAMQAVRAAYGSLDGTQTPRRALEEARSSLHRTLGVLSKEPEEARAAKQVLFSVYKGRSDPFAIFYDEERRADKLVEGGFPSKVEPWTRRFAVRPTGGAGWTDAGVRLSREESDRLGTPLTEEQIRAGYFEVRTKVSKTVAMLPTRGDAEAAARRLYESSLERDAKTEPERPHLDTLKRDGMPQAIDRDVTAEDFLKHFGFRGVEFGNWSAQDERQKLLNLAYDGLTDLASILGVPPKAMSLNGTMGMAFGARGGGRFAAHYEPGKLVINMTKIRGGGSLAHEWAHALDHYLGELDRPDAYKTLARGATGWNDQARYSPEGVTRTQLNPETGKHETRKLPRLPNLRPELAGTIDAVMQRLYEAPVAQDVAIAEAEKDLERSRRLAAEERDPKLRTIYEEAARARAIRLEDVRNGAPGRTDRSQYAAEAQKLSGKSSDGYWLRPTEMWARAFESYVFDRLVAMGARSEYLVHGVEADRFAAADRYKGNPYPVGEERAAINAKFDAFVAALQTREEGDRTVLFQRRPAPEIALSTDDFGGPEAPLRDRINAALLHARASFAGVSVVNESDGSAITIPASGLKHAMSGQVSSVALAAMRRVPELVRRARFVGSEPDKKGRNTVKEVRFYEARVSLDGAPATLRVVVRVAPDGARYYDHFELKEKAPAGQSGKPGDPDSLQPFAGALPTEAGADSVADLDGDAAMMRTDRAAQRLEAAQEAVDVITAQWANAPQVVVIDNMGEAPERVRQENERQLAGGASGEPAAFVYGGRVYLVARQLRSTQQLAEALFHEALGHLGLRGVFGRELDTVLRQFAAARSDLVWQKAKEYGLDFSDEQQRLRAAEEVLAELAQTRPGSTWVQKLIAVIRSWLRQNVPVLSGIQMSDAEVVMNYIAPARAFIERGAEEASHHIGLAFARAERDAPRFRRAPAVLDGDIAFRRTNPQPGTLRASTGLVDVTLRKLGGSTLARLTSPLYDRLIRVADRGRSSAFGDAYETAKAGLVDSYGLSEPYIDAKQGMKTAMRRGTRGIRDVLDALQVLDRAQSRVAYLWMQEKPDAAEEQRLMAALPEESRQTLVELKQRVDELGREAMQLGLMSQEVYERNAMAYLHRSYARHELENRDAKAARSRSIKILGDQFKGRGMRDDAGMEKIGAPGWFERKTARGRADVALKGQRFHRLELRGLPDNATPDMLGNRQARLGPLRQVIYWPAGEPSPPEYADWRNDGLWEARFFDKAGKVGMWRDFTLAERTTMGEIQDVRYSVAKTLMQMTRDVETARLLDWVARREAVLIESQLPDGAEVVPASERLTSAFKPREWVQVSTAKIPGTDVTRYGNLAGRYVPGPIWNDLRQIAGLTHQGDIARAYGVVLNLWKISKTALSPVTHMNNVMSNFVFADMHDIQARHIAKALRTWATWRKDEDAKALVEAYQDNGGDAGKFNEAELNRELFEELMAELERDINANTGSELITASAVLDLLRHREFRQAFATMGKTKTAGALSWLPRKMIKLYGVEDEAFRLAAFIKAREDGLDDAAAGKFARESFLNYDINAPWINALRRTVMPFLSFTYRTVPMLASTAARKPWKAAKYAMVAGALNAFAYWMLGGDDEDEERERALMPEEKAGKVWGLVPKLIRMPWNDANGSPVFLDIRRWVPGGDIVDFGQQHTAIPIPPPLMPGGPMVLLGEVLANRSMFTGEDITKETDTLAERYGKVADYLWKSAVPNMPVVPGSYSFDAVARAGSGQTDTFGREYSLGQAGASAIGIKLASYPRDALLRNASLEAQAQIREVRSGLNKDARQLSRNGITEEEFAKRRDRALEKIGTIAEDLNRRISAGQVATGQSAP